MPEFHESVLAEAVAKALVPAIAATPEAVLVDATCGAGGHTAALLARCSPAKVVLLDRDPAALEFARTRLEGAECALHFVHARFSSLAAVLDELGIESVAALIADIGVSSHQFDAGERGFSFRADAPLDMRMDPTRGRSAGELLAEIDEAGLAELLRRYGEEPEARRIAKAVIVARPRTTGALAQVVEEAMSARARRQLGRRIHPATRTFQALRIAVNEELEELDALLEAGPERLAVGGRMGVISFHSLEDRRIKRRFAALSRVAELPHGLPLTADQLPKAPFQLAAELPRRGVVADAAERDRNPRSRSARLRVLERRS
ncbi:16S rRNA (cytosine(1402)-N(4))-methyltransferase RsmH [Pseudenhygromyxa sp. WMMC2535]|uniref:16S rRNA (cytosine(1402)-N(4))-methyltransferase RsmH n=1 Tax=Pseudenhygromyxa sp. WMMC2535 TaxID=2712867 RepID=UPI0031F72810